MSKEIPFKKFHEEHERRLEASMAEVQTIEKKKRQKEILLAEMEVNRRNRREIEIKKILEELKKRVNDGDLNNIAVLTVDLDPHPSLTAETVKKHVKEAIEAAEAAFRSPTEDNKKAAMKAHEVLCFDSNIVIGDKSRRIYDTDKGRYIPLVNDARYNVLTPLRVKPGDIICAAENLARAMGSLDDNFINFASQHLFVE